VWCELFVKFGVGFVVLSLIGCVGVLWGWGSAVVGGFVEVACGFAESCVAGGRMDGWGASGFRESGVGDTGSRLGWCYGVFGILVIAGNLGWCG